MQYKYCQNENFEDFASGRVILHKHGFPNFPVRLAQEIYCRCLSYIKNKTDVCIYDPCGGSGYMLTVIGFLNLDSLKTMICSDLNGEALEIADTNLSLLTVGGLEKRISHLHNLYTQFNRQSHIEAAESAKTLMNLIKEEHNINTINKMTFQADILSKNIKNILEEKNFKADIIITDIPYGNLSSWQENEDNSMSNLLDNLIPVIKPESVVAVCSNKRQKILSENYIRLEKQQIGKRKFEIFTLR
jgi:tRNA G10  N-methylase Trm11